MGSQPRLASPVRASEVETGLETAVARSPALSRSHVCRNSTIGWRPGAGLQLTVSEGILVGLVRPHLHRPPSAMSAISVFAAWIRQLSEIMAYDTV